MKAATPTLTWMPSERTIETVQKIHVVELYLTQSEVKAMILNHIMEKYRLSYHEVEVSVSLLDINRTDDAALVTVTKPESTT